MATLIPRRIHYCWFGGGPKPPLVQRCLASWRRVMPDYPVTEWNETNTPMDSKYMRRGRKRQLWARIANVARLHALYQQGGFYLDTDVEVLKRFDPLRKEECLLGFQQEEPDEDWVNNGVIGAVPGHPFLKQVMEAVLDHYQRTGEFRRFPALLTEMLRARGLRAYGDQVVAGVRLVPAEYFYPYPWWETFDPACVTPRTYALHHWQISWLDPVERDRVIARRRQRANATGSRAGRPPQ